MAWTAPRTWTDGELVTASIMNAHVSANFTSMGPHLIARKTADESTSIATLQDDDTLILPIGASEVWYFRFVFIGVSNTNLQVALTHPAAAIVRAALLGLGIGQVDNAPIGSTDGTSPTNTQQMSVNNDIGMPTVVEGIVTNSTTAGNVTLQWAPTTAVSMTIKANSTLWAVKLA